MSKKQQAKEPRKQKAEKKKKQSPLDPLKMEIASEIGLAEKVKKVGWGGLTSRESGRLGGLMTRRMRQNDKDSRNS